MRAAAFAPRPCGGRDDQRRGRHVAQRDVADGSARSPRACRSASARPSPSRITPTCDVISARRLASAERRAWRNCAAPSTPAAARGRGECACRRCPRRCARQRPRLRAASSRPGGWRHARRCEETSPPAHRPVERGAAARVDGDAAHVIVRGRRDRDRLRRRIDAGGDAACIDRREIARRNCAPSASRASRNAPRPAAISANTPRATMSRGASSAERMLRQHEALALGVDQRRAFAAQRFGRERRRIAADHDRGRVELHEFRIGDDGAGARGDRQPEPAGLRRIGRHGIEMPDAAGRQHHRARGDVHGLCRGVAGLAQLQPGDARRPSVSSASAT